MSQLRITLERSVIGYAQRQKDTVLSLGLRRINQSIVRPDNPAIRGMINRVTHLVSVEEIEDKGD